MISIIIPTYNRASLLSTTLPSYLEQKKVSEIIIVDDLSTDNTSDVISQYIECNKNKHIQIRYIKHPCHKGAASARLTGIIEAKNQYIVFGEDDVIFDRNYISILHDDMEKTHADIIAGRIIYLKDNESYESGIKRYNELKLPIIDYRTLEGHFGVNVPKPVEVPFVHACFLAKKEVYSNIKYDTNFAGNGYREETDPQISALEVGKKIVYTPNTYCYHLPRSVAGTGGQWTMNALWYSYWVIKNNIYFLKKHYSFLSQKYNLEPYSFMLLHIILFSLKNMVIQIYSRAKSIITHNATKLPMF